MKKFLAGIAAAAIITVPMTSFALESMSKGALKKATAQAGVSIGIDNVVIVQKSQPTTIYWDNDGTSALSGTLGDITKAGVSISYDNLAEKLIVLDGILDADNYGTSKLEAKFNISANSADFGISKVGIAETADLAAGKIDPTNGNTKEASAGEYITGISPLTIDVGTCQSLTAGFKYNTVGTKTYDVAGVVIGLPTIEITTYHSNDVKTISVVAETASDDVLNDGVKDGLTTSNQLISIEKSGTSQMAILGGRLEIAPH